MSTTLVYEVAVLRPAFDSSARSLARSDASKPLVIAFRLGASNLEDFDGKPYCRWECMFMGTPEEIMVEACGFASRVECGGFATSSRWARGRSDIQDYATKGAMWSKDQIEPVLRHLRRMVSEPARYTKGVWVARLDASRLPAQLSGRAQEHGLRLFQSGLSSDGFGRRDQEYYELAADRQEQVFEWRRAYSIAPWALVHPIVH